MATQRWKMRSLLVLSVLSGAAYAADCKVAVVGSPYSSCWDIATAAGITTDKLQSFNPGLNCALLQIGQRLCISSGSLPDIRPQPNPDGTCATHTVQSGEYCALIASRYGITTQNIESWNENTYKWKGCALLAVGFKMCVSTGDPPPIPVNPNLQCGPESPGNATCPLKACCSAFGFCGLTSEFCEDAPNGDPCISNCGDVTLKTCDGGQLKRKIGYYAGWATRRTCQKFYPKDLDLNGFTDVIFAFAEITEGMEITIASEDDQHLRDLVALKEEYSGLKVTIAVGGWAFSTEDPTKTLFSVMIANSANRQKFINSAKSFITKYNLDGIDIDMEYPSAIERSAPAEDTPNLTAFFSDLKTAMSGKIISVATPAGYWFLKGFQIDKIADSVTYINMMSYDYHGPWDKDVLGEDGRTNPHTSIKDITDSAKLYTRAGVDLGKVNLGLAWYGRSFDTGSCIGSSCQMTGGGAPGPCTGESGILSQLEIWEDSASEDPNFDSGSQTYWYNKDGDFITFDDQSTWDYKTDWAGDHCFGGTFVWSLDQVRPKPPPPPIETECHYAVSSETLENCKTLVNNIQDSDTFHMNSSQCYGIIGIKPKCEGDCCLFMTFPDFLDRKLSAKEVKLAAKAILDQCHGSSLAVIENKKRLSVVAGIALIWNTVAIGAMVGFLVGLVATVLAAVFKEIWNDDDERRAFVLKTIGEARDRAPEWNILIAHSEHTYEFEDPWFHEHIEYDRPFPWGTFGYEVYHARAGTFELLGDGDYINWAYSGYITADEDNEKKLTLFAGGTSYGIAAIKAHYSDDEDDEFDIGVGLGNAPACISCFL